MELLFEYLMFLAQAATVVVALLVVISSLASLLLGDNPKRMKANYGYIN